MEAFRFKNSMMKQVLKMLFKKNDNNWDYIKTNYYNVLAHCIFDLLEASIPPPTAALAMRSKMKWGNDQALPLVNKPKMEFEALTTITVVDSGESDEVLLQRYKRIKRTLMLMHTLEVKVE